MFISKISKNEINNILKCIQNNNEDEVICSLTKLVNKCHWTEISYKDTGDTILHYAARNGLSKVVKYLLENFTPKLIDIGNKDDKTSLHEAAQFSHTSVCDILLTHGAKVNAIKRGDWTPLMLACTKNNGIHNLNTVKLLINHGAIVNYKNKDGWTCLHLIARLGDVQIMQLLIENDLNVNLKTKNGRSALHVAALHGHLKIIDMLLKLEVNINERDNCGNTPICEAVLGNHVVVCQQLVDNEADYSVINMSSHSLIHLAAFEGHIEMLQFCINVLNFDVNFVNQNNVTPLHCAARKKNLGAYKFLVANGASEIILDNFNRTPVEYLN